MKRDALVHPSGMRASSLPLVERMMLAHCALGGWFKVKAGDAPLARPDKTRPGGTHPTIGPWVWCYIPRWKVDPSKEPLWARAADEVIATMASLIPIAHREEMAARLRGPAGPYDDIPAARVLFADNAGNGPDCSAKGCVCRHACIILVATGKQGLPAFTAAPLVKAVQIYLASRN